MPVPVLGPEDEGRGLGRMRAKARAYTMQALVKYHGLKDWRLRIPYHDSISVNTDVAYVVAEVSFGDSEEDVVMANGTPLTGRARERVVAVLDRVRELAGIEERAVVRTENHPRVGAKGLGFSSAAGASIAMAAYAAAGLDRVYGRDLTLVSRIARLLAGSACRSVVGKYARWYAGTGDHDSYAVSFADERNLPLRFAIVPLGMEATTEEAHREAESSPYFLRRIEVANERCDRVERAIKEGDFRTFGAEVERDSLELHAITMTGNSGMILMSPDTLRVIELVKQMRRSGIEAYFSMQTGPTVYVNTLPEHIDEVAQRLREAGYEVMVSGVGGGAELISS